MKFSTSIRAAVVCALAFGGCVCGRHTPDGGFVLDAVAPSPVVAGVRAKVALKGAGFRVSVRSDLGAKTVTSDSISASAGPADLQSPVLRDDGLIDAVVPDTLEPGVWPVSLSIGGTAAGGTPALEVVAPIELALHATGEGARNARAGVQEVEAFEQTVNAPPQPGTREAIELTLQCQVLSRRCLQVNRRLLRDDTDHAPHTPRLLYDIPPHNGSAASRGP